MYSRSGAWTFLVLLLVATPVLLPLPARGGAIHVALPAAPIRETWNFTATRDAYVDSASPDRNFGGRPRLIVGHDAGGATYRALVGFDLAAIPPSATVESATLRGGPVTAASPGSLDLYRIRAPWVEGAGSGAAYERTITVEEEGNLARTREPVIVHMDVPGGIVTDPQADFLVFDSIGEEVPSQTMNVTVAGGRVWSLDLVFASTIGRLETKTYTLRYGLTPLPPVPAYRMKTFTGAPLWTYEAGGVLSSPAVGDLDGDGVLEVVVGTITGRVVALRWDGTTLSTLWTYVTDGASIFPIRIADLTGDGSSEVLFTTGDFTSPYNHTVTALSAAGRYLWHFPLPEFPSSPLAAADTDGDGIVEVFAGDASAGPIMYVIRGSNGTSLCSYNHLGADFLVGLAIGDVALSTAREVVITDSGGHIRLRDPDCTNSVPGNGRPGSSSMFLAPSLANLSGDARREILIGDRNGANSQMFLVSGVDYSTIAATPALGANVTGGSLVADADRDGILEAYFLTEDGALHRVDANLNAAPPGWTFPGAANGTTWAAPAAGDLDRDGRPEILFGTDGAVVYAVSAAGAEIRRWVVGAPVRTTPVVADLDGDGTMEVLFASDNSSDASRTAGVYAFGTGSLGHDIRTAGYNVAASGLWGDGNSPEGKPLLRVSVGPATSLDAGVTWNTRDGLIPWAAPGVDMDATPAASAVASPAAVVSWNLTGLVQNWVAGFVPNNGVAVRAADESAPWNASLPSREGAPDPGPVLEVTFTHDPAPGILGSVPDQVRPEDSPSWTLDLLPYASDADTPPTRLQWDLGDMNASLYRVLGANVTGNHVLTFQPLPDAYGDDAVTLFLFDDLGNFDVQPLWVNLTPVNDAPRFTPPFVFHVRYDAPYPFDFAPYMSDVDDPLPSLILVSDDPVHAPASQHEITFLYPRSYLDQWVYVVLSVSDGQAPVSQVVAVRVTANYPPALAQSLPDQTLVEGETRLGVFDLDDYFTDPDQDSLYYAFGPAHVTVTIDATSHLVDLAAPGEWTGTESVTFRAQDPTGAIAEDTILVTVVPVNDPPTLAALPPLVVHYDHPYAFDLTPYLADPDTPLDDLVVGTSNPANVTVQGRVLTLLYPARLGALQWPYIVPLTVTVSDGTSSAFQPTSVSVAGDFPPVLNRTLDDVTFPEDTALSGRFDLDDYFLDNDSARVFYASGQVNVQVTIHPDGVVDFTANANWSGGEFVRFRATDDEGALAEDLIFVAVTPVNDAPVISRIPRQVRQGLGSWVLDLAAYVVDSDTNQSLLVGSTGGHARVRAVGLILVFDYSRAAYVETVTITVSDGILTAQASIEVEVVGPSAIWSLFPWIVAAAILLALFLVNRHVRVSVEEVFVIARNGLLVSHLSRSLTPDRDRDSISGMLTAVQEFVHDAFRGTENAVYIETMDLGPYRVSITRGSSFYLAILYRGFSIGRLKRKSLSVVREIEARWATALELWSGRMSEVEGVGPLLETVFRARTTELAAGRPVS